LFIDERARHASAFTGRACERHHERAAARGRPFEFADRGDSDSGGVVTLRIDGFTDIKPLAGGGFGSVYRATRASTGGVVALKVLDRAHGDDDDLLERRLRREISALVALKGHPNVVQVEEVVASTNGPTIVMEFMGRGSVLDVDIPGGTSAARVAFIGSAVASGLQAAHQAGIVHRDVKPQNVLVNTFGTVKLCDFGIAAIQKSTEFQTHTTALSVRYASPEELDGAPDIGAPTDVYSLGASMFHLLYGEPPSFRGGRGADPSLTRSRRGEDRVRDRVSSIIEGCLAEDPAQRPTANDCYGMLSDPAGSLHTESRVSPIVARRRRRRAEQDDITEERPDRSGRHGDRSGPPESSSAPHDPSGPSDASAPSAEPVSRPPALPSTSNEQWWR
jgi:serine/threonine protein kinase